MNVWLHRISNGELKLDDGTSSLEREDVLILVNESHRGDFLLYNVPRKRSYGIGE